MYIKQNKIYSHKIGMWIIAFIFLKKKINLGWFNLSLALLGQDDARDHQCI